VSSGRSGDLPYIGWRSHHGSIVARATKVHILDEIIAAKRQRVAEAKKNRPLAELRAAIETRYRWIPHALSRALADCTRLNIIAEFKRRSPSKGVIRAHADPAIISHAYELGGAAAISVLTEEDFFQGSLADFAKVRQTTKLPLLRKDFIFDTYQVFETAAAGADALLLIVAALSDGELKTLREIAEEELGLDALVEVHTSDELKRAIAAGARLVGVNNRDLRTFAVSLDVSVRLAHEAPNDLLLVSESGLHWRADLLRLQVEGFKAFLMGESLMRAEEPAAALRALLSDNKSRV
jgi:indole-3-glycerol phosphate synthase